MPSYSLEYVSQRTFKPVLSPQVYEGCVQKRKREVRKPLLAKQRAGCLFTSCWSTLRCLSKTPIILVILLMAAFVKATMKDVPRTSQLACTLACKKSRTETASTEKAARKGLAGRVPRGRHELSPRVNYHVRRMVQPRRCRRAAPRKGRQRRNCQNQL